MGAQRNQIQKVVTVGAVGSIDAKESGVWNYTSGTAGGTVAITGRVVGMFAYAKTEDGTVTINGGASIPVRTGNGFILNPKGVLEDPTFVFSSDLDYMIEYVI
jgi:hypothetical protein